MRDGSECEVFSKFSHVKHGRTPSNWKESNRFVRRWRNYWKHDRHCKSKTQAIFWFGCQHEVCTRSQSHIRTRNTAKMATERNDWKMPPKANRNPVIACVLWRTDGVGDTRTPQKTEAKRELQPNGITKMRFALFSAQNRTFFGELLDIQPPHIQLPALSVPIVLSHHFQLHALRTTFFFFVFFFSVWTHHRMPIVNCVGILFGK